MKKLTRKWAINAFFILILLILVSSSAIVYRQMKNFVISNDWVNHTYIVISTNDALLISVLNTNKLEEEYLNTGNVSILQKEQTTLQDLPSGLTTIKKLTSDNPDEQKLIEELEPLISKFIASLQKDTTIYQHHNQQEALLLITSKDQINTINEIRNLISRINYNEENLLNSRIVGTAEFGHNANLSFLLYSTLSNLLVVFIFYLLYLNEKKHLAQQTNVNIMLEVQNKKLVEAIQLKNDFLENMSHEFLTPLNGIIGFSEIIHAEKAGPLTAIQKEYLNTILTSSRRLFQLIKDLLDLQQLEDNQIKFHPLPTNLTTLTNEVREDFNKLAEAKSIQIDIQIDQTINHIVIDPKKFKQILYNYLSNAIKFTNNGGNISIRILSEGIETLKLEIEDTGIGIHEEDMHKLFVAFQQIDTGTAKKYEGVGLGLALTRRIIEAQGGKAGATSIKGKGSVFFAILPYKLFPL